MSDTGRPRSVSLKSLSDICRRHASILTITLHSLLFAMRQLVTAEVPAESPEDEVKRKCMESLNDLLHQISTDAAHIQGFMEDLENFWKQHYVGGFCKVWNSNKTLFRRFPELECLKDKAEKEMRDLLKLGSDLWINSDHPAAEEANSIPSLPIFAISWQDGESEDGRDWIGILYGLRSKNEDGQEERIIRFTGAHSDVLLSHMIVQTCISDRSFEVLELEEDGHLIDPTEQPLTGLGKKIIQKLKAVSSFLAHPLDSSPDKQCDRILDIGTSPNERILLGGKQDDFGIGQTWLLIPIGGTLASPGAVTYLKTPDSVQDGEADLISLQELPTDESIRKVSSQFLKAFRASRELLTKTEDPCHEVPSTADIQSDLISRLEALASATSQRVTEVDSHLEAQRKDILDHTAACALLEYLEEPPSPPRLSFEGRVVPDEEAVPELLSAFGIRDNRSVSPASISLSGASSKPSRNKRSGSPFLSSRPAPGSFTGER